MSGIEAAALIALVVANQNIIISTVGGIIGTAAVAKIKQAFSYSAYRKNKQLVKLAGYLAKGSKVVLEKLEKVLPEEDVNTIRLFKQTTKGLSDQFSIIDENDIVFFTNIGKVLKNGTSFKDYLKKADLCNRIAKIIFYKNLELVNDIKDVEQKYLKHYLGEENYEKFEEAVVYLESDFYELKNKYNLYTIGEDSFKDLLKKHLRKDTMKLRTMVMEDIIDHSYLDGRDISEKTSVSDVSLRDEDILELNIEASSDEEPVKKSRNVFNKEYYRNKRKNQN